MILLDNYRRIMWRDFARPQGRAGRAEFWYFRLMCFLIAILTVSIDHFLPRHVMTAIVGLLQFIPTLFLDIRRMHDLNRSGWWLLLLLIPLIGLIAIIVMFCRKGTDGPNRFGDPEIIETYSSETHIVFIVVSVFAILCLIAMIGIAILFLGAVGGMHAAG